MGTYEALPFLERLGLLVEQECQREHPSRNGSFARPALSRATVQDIDYQHPRNVKQEQIARLAQGEWISRAQNLLITGPCGSGKTYIACALGHNACLQGYSARYYRLSRLLLALTQAKADGSYSKLLKQIARTGVLLIDDWGLETLNTAQRNDLMEIMDDRHGSINGDDQPVAHRSMVCLPGDNTLADAILDRLMHNAHRLPLKGESMRKMLNQLTEREHLE